jgi:hypothetical protein
MAIREVHLYDFDATLFKSPQKPQGFNGPWWSQPFSLGPPCMDSNAPYWISSVVNEAKKSIGRSDVFAAVVTGRKEPMRAIVEKLLANKGLRFARVYLSRGGSTDAYKQKVLRALSSRNPDAVFHIWEDRHDHLAGFVRLLEGLGHKAVGHPVPEQYSQAQCTPEVLDALVSGQAPLRAAMLRLAHEVPELRQHLVPSLRDELP